MRNYYLMTVLTVFCSTASAAPVCQNGSATDPDGDGWGWENNASCMVTGGDEAGGGSADGGNTGGGETSSTAGCDYSFAGDNGGWGWNSTTGESCPPDNTGQTQQPTGNPVSIVREPSILGNWECNEMDLRRDSSWEPGVSHSPGYSGNDITGVYWGNQFGLYSSGDNGRQGQGHFSKKRYEFNADGTVAIYTNYTEIYATDTLPAYSFWASSSQVAWDWQGYSLLIDGTATHRVGFENYQGTDFLHIYQSDWERTTCRAD